MTTRLTRRTLLAAALATGAAAPLGIASRGAAAAPTPSTAPGRAAGPAPARLTLPRPTGPHRIGRVSLRLVDRSQPDPVAGPGRHREMMADVWYPAGFDGRRHPVAPWMTPAWWRAVLEVIGIDPGAAAAPLTAAREGAPVLPAPGRLPVVVYSHGNDSCRTETTVVVQELAAHGYVVATVDHTYDGVSEFPDGRITVPAEDSFTPWDSARDMRFLLDRLGDLAAGRNPDADGRPLPPGLGGLLDVRRIGMLGWSKGATSTALVMNTDRRVRAGLAFDGPMQSQPPVAGVDRPFMLMTAELTRAAEPSVEEFWSQLTGWRLDVRACGAAHGSYNDQQWLIPQLARRTGMSGEELAGWIGALDPARAVRIQQAYPLAFFDRHLRGRRSRLLDGPSPAFPEVRFLP